MGPPSRPLARRIRRSRFSLWRGEHRITWPRRFARAASDPNRYLPHTSVVRHLIVRRADGKGREPLLAGYEPVKGKKKNEQGSCRKKAASKSTDSEKEFQSKREQQLERWKKDHPKSP